MSCAVERRALLAVLLLSACTPPGDHRPAPPPAPPPFTAENALRRLPAPRLPPLYDDGDLAALGIALRHSRDWYRRRPPARRFVAGPRSFSAGEMAAALDGLLARLTGGMPAEQLAALVAYDFEAYESIGGGDGEMLVTGYYEPVIEASLKRAPGYEVPIYRPPPGLVRVDLGDFADDLAGRRLIGWLRGGRLVPLPDRRALRQGGLRGRELAWARDRVDLFFLEIQGSGTLRLRDGRLMRIGYAGSNGHPYRSIGRLLAEEGAIPRQKVSMQSIRAWLAAHPEEVERVLDHNPSTVFFRRLDGPPRGSLGLPVTAGRSIATDHDLFPPGALAFLVTEVPALAADGTTVAERPLRRFVLNQDRGGAIRGPGRVDYFWGRGDEAAYRAGAMKQPGRLIVFVPKARDSAAPAP
ncbi:MAG: transglycosylase [Acidobacteria bacterium]|nr:MAG: transglycosylase [Acidobacteriota bacterium]